MSQYFINSSANVGISSRSNATAAKVLPGANFGGKFTNFNILQAVYKVVDGHEIRANLIFPRSISTGKAPVIVHFHGGGLITGDSLYEDWFPLWLLDLAEANGAVIISANYRFLPESTGLDILDDIDDFWTWIHSENLTKLLLSVHEDFPIQLDLDRILTAGESAGGLLSIYLTLSQPDKIRAGTAAYPALGYDNPPLLTAGKSSLLPDLPESYIEEYLANQKPGYVVSSDPTLQRLKLTSAISGNKRTMEFYIRNSEKSPHRDRLYQLSRLDKPDAKLPRGGLVILHGLEDDVVLVEASERFVNKARDVLKGKQGGDKVILATQSGVHGFDKDVHLKEPWLSEALKTAIGTWLQ